MAEFDSGDRRTVHSIAVDIYDQTYHLRGTDPAYIEKLATMVDSKMRAVAARGNTVDSLRVAVLAALNMADELARLEEKHRALHGEGADSAALRARANHLSGLLDMVLEDSRRAG